MLSASFTRFCWLLLVTACIASCADQDRGPPPGAKVISTPSTLVLQVRKPAAGAYPPDLLRSSAEGSVDLDCIVTTDGTPKNCVVTASSDQRFDTAALQLEMAVRYVPAVQDGAPVYFEHHVFHVNYRLHSKPPEQPAL